MKDIIIIIIIIIIIPNLQTKLFIYIQGYIEIGLYFPSRQTATKSFTFI
jgi:hypothetical protein